MAVGTESEPSIDCTTRALTPRSGSNVDAEGVIKTGTGLTIGSAGVAGVIAFSRTTGCVDGVGVTGGATCETGA